MPHSSQCISVYLETKDETMRENFSMLFSVHYQGRCKLDSYESAHVHIFDSCHPNYIRITAKYSEKFPKKPAIIIGYSQEKNHITLSKPVNIQQLWKAILQIYKTCLTENRQLPPMTPYSGVKATYDAAASMESILEFEADNWPIPPTQNTGEASYDNSEYYEGYFQRVVATARDTGKMYTTTFWRDRYAAYDPNSHEVLTNINPSQYPDLGTKKIGHGIQFELKELNGEDFQMLMFDADVRLYSAEQFSWMLSLYTGRGRLPQYVDDNGVFSLSFWPNLSRLQRPPQITRICSLLARQALTCEQITEMLQIQPWESRLCIAACLAIGAVNCDKDIQPAQPFLLKSHDKRGLFQRILKHLGLASAVEKTG